MEENFNFKNDINGDFINKNHDNSNQNDKEKEKDLNTLSNQNDKEIILNSDDKNSFEINIIKLNKIQNFLNVLDKKETKEYIQYIKDIEKDINNILKVKLSKKEKELLIKYVK